MKKFAILLILAVCSYLTDAIGQTQQISYVDMLKEQNRWVDSVYKKLNRRHKIAQLFFIRAHTNLGQAYADSIAQVIKDEQPGGLVFFQGGPVRQAILTNQYQKLAEIPLLIAMDGEWGLGMRLDSTMSYPYQMTLGAAQNNTLINRMGQEIAYDFKRIGAHLNFAPVMDVNNNPDNPVINYRSFGDNKYNVAAKAIAYMQGMQQGGLLTTAKHFPGHGDTNVDSHQDLPQLNFTRQRLDTLEEYPFKQAIAAGISGIMIAHMNIPALDATKNLPSTLSRPIVTGNLKQELGFTGLVVSDAMEMKGVVKYFPAGEADLRAFIAGNDILELSENSARAIKKIRVAIRKGQIAEEELNAKVRKVLTAKYWAGLNAYQPVNITGITADLNRPQAKTLVQQLSDAAITLLQGDSVLQQLDTTKATALVSIGADMFTTYQLELAKVYRNSTSFVLAKNAPANEVNNLLLMLKNYDQVIVGIHDNRLRPQSKLDFSNNIKQAIAQLATLKNTVMSVFANPYAIATLPGIERSGVLLAAYQKDDSMQRAAAKVITHQLKATGKLPVKLKSVWNNDRRIAVR